MKTVILAALLMFGSMGLFAQTDSTATSPTNNTSTTPATPPAVDQTPATNTTTNGSMNNSANGTVNAATTTDSTGAANNQMNNMNATGTTNQTMNNNSSWITKPKASLPVHEDLIPADVASAIEQKAGGDQVYDITAVAAPVDSSMMNNNTMNNNTGNSMFSLGPNNNNNVFNSMSSPNLNSSGSFGTQQQQTPGNRTVLKAKSRRKNPKK